MSDIDFGSIGVDVANWTPGSIHDLLTENGLGTFINDHGFYSDNHNYSTGNYLQTDSAGSINEETRVSVLNGYIRYVTDIDTFILILSTALLDMDTANALINDLYYEGLIKPRNVL